MYASGSFLNGQYLQQGENLSVRSLYSSLAEFLSPGLWKIIPNCFTESLPYDTISKETTLHTYGIFFSTA